MKLKTLTLSLVAAGVLVAGSANALGWNAGVWFQNSNQNSSQGTAPAHAVAVSAPVLAPAGQPVGSIAAPNYRGIVEQYGPAVVGILTEGTTKTALQGNGDDEQAMPDDPFQYFFRGMPGQGGQGKGGRAPRGQAPVVRGQGSGFILSQDGLILTNAHVVQDANEVTVKLSDRREFKAKVLGSDRATDVAVLKIQAQGLPVVRLGNPAQLSVGDYVLAIGSPFGFEQSATAGIVSAKARSLPGDAYVPFIQTDVAVNPGNSGGPLFDASGQVVGINSQIYSRTGGYQGVSFAIPIDVALKIKDQIVASGKAVHARLGVSIQEVNQTLAESFNLKRPEGALVAAVEPDGAGAKAGLRPGDVVLKYNGKTIERSGDLPAQVGMSKPGDKGTMEVWRDGKVVTLNATLGEVPGAAAQADAGPAAGKQGRLGLAVRPVTPEEKGAGAPGGVLVEQAGGAGARAGIAAGDVIIAVNGTPVQSVEQLRSLVAGASKTVAVLVQRGADKIFIPVKLG